MGLSTGWAGCVQHSLEPYEFSRVDRWGVVDSQLRWRDEEKTQ